MTEKSVVVRHLVLSGVKTWDFWNFRRGLLQALLRAGYRVTVLAAPDEARPALIKLGVSVVDLPFANGSRNPLRDIALLFRYCRLLRQLRADALISYGIKPVIWGSIAARLCRVPSLAVVTGLGSAFLGNVWLRRLVEGLYRFALAGTKRIFFLNPADCDYFVARGLVAAGKFELLPGEGLDPEYFAYQPRPAFAAPFVFLFVGRMLRDKGLVEFVSAARRLHSAGLAVDCRLLGGIDAGNPSAISAAEIDQWERAGTVRYLGTVADVRQHIAAADVVVLPSYREGMPRALLEAGALGRACIATDVPGCRDIVVDGETGWLCRPRDADDLFAKMRLARGVEASRLDIMGQQARRRIKEQFGDSQVTARYIDYLPVLFQSKASG